jgi:hypothetical protein
MLADILPAQRRKVGATMAKTKDKSQVAIETLGPYVKRAMEDPELRDDLLAAFIAARSLYGQFAKSSGVKGKAGKVTDKDFQKQLQELVGELSEASDRLQGSKTKKGHKTRNRVILLTGVTLGVLYNPWTGEATRDWIMSRVAGGDGNGFEDFADDLAAESESATPGDGSEPAGES